MCDEENREETYKRIIDDALNNTNNSENDALGADELEKVIESYLKSLDINKITYPDLDKIADEIDMSIYFVFSAANKYYKIELDNFEEYKKYIRHKMDLNECVDIFVSKSGVYSGYEYKIPDSCRELLKLHGCNIDSIEQYLTAYLIDNKIQIDDCIITTTDGVGVRCKPYTDVLKNLAKIFDKCLEIIIDTMYGRAIQELNGLEKDAAVVNYKEEIMNSSYSIIHTLLGIRDKLNNEDTRTSKYQSLYSRYDTLVK